MKILITGSLGFIATNLICKLSSLECFELIGVDNRASNSNNIKYTSALCDHRFFDLSDVTQLRNCLRGVDLVVHLAAMGNVIDSIKSPVDNFHNNVLSTFNLLESMRTENVKRIVFSSTGGALMGNTPPPVSECSVPSPISPYGASKLACEAYLSAYSESFDFDCVALRFGNVYGRYSLHKTGVINKWILSALNSIPISIFGDGSSTRDYIHVSDLVDGICTSIQLILSDDLSGFSKFHLANSIPVSLSYLLSVIENAHGSKINISYHSERLGEVKFNFADTTLSRDVLGFSPSTVMDDGILDLYDWIKTEHA